MRILTGLGILTASFLAIVYINCYFRVTIMNNSGYDSGTPGECFMETLEEYKGAIYGSR